MIKKFRLQLIISLVLLAATLIFLGVNYVPRTQASSKANKNLVANGAQNLSANVNLSLAYNNSDWIERHPSIFYNSSDWSERHPSTYYINSDWSERHPSTYYINSDWIERHPGY
jgi:hypothetical protein